MQSGQRAARRDLEDRTTRSVDRISVARHEVPAMGCGPVEIPVRALHQSTGIKPVKTVALLHAEAVE